MPTIGTVRGGASLIRVVETAAVLSRVMPSAPSKHITRESNWGPGFAAPSRNATSYSCQRGAISATTIDLAAQRSRQIGVGLDQELGLVVHPNEDRIGVEPQVCPRRNVEAGKLGAVFQRHVRRT